MLMQVRNLKIKLSEKGAAVQATFTRAADGTWQAKIEIKGKTTAKLGGTIDTKVIMDALQDFFKMYPAGFCNVKTLNNISLGDGSISAYGDGGQSIFSEMHADQAQKFMAKLEKGAHLVEVS